MQFALKVLVSACVISFASWLSGRAPRLAGFFVALPIATALVLPLSYLEHHSREQSILLARSILIAIPITALYFVPFLLADRLELSFWQAYVSGFFVMALGFWLHRWVASLLA